MLRVIQRVPKQTCLLRGRACALRQGLRKREPEAVGLQQPGQLRDTQPQVSIGGLVSPQPDIPQNNTYSWSLPLDTEAFERPDNLTGLGKSCH